MVNETESQNCYSPGYLIAAAKIGKTFACCLFFVVSLAGNTLIAIIIYKTKTMQTTTNYFILNMAMSDLLLPILVFPSILMDMYGGFWFFSGEQGQAFCKVMLLIQYVSCVVSIENLVLIAVDRFGAVVFPLRPPLIGSKLCLFFILTTWVAAISLSSPASSATNLLNSQANLIVNGCGNTPFSKIIIFMLCLLFLWCFLWP